MTSRLFVLVPDVRRDDEAQTLLGTENAVGVIYPVEAPVGAITAVVGAVVLLILLRRRAA